MQDSTANLVMAIDGPLGVIAARPDDPTGRVTVRLTDGGELLVPLSALVSQKDGSYSLPMRREDVSPDISARSAPEEETVIPVVAEELVVDKRQVTKGGVRVHKLVHEHEEVVDMPLIRDHVDIRRVLVGRDVDGPMPIRREGETIIIPVVEEVLVVEKRLRLKEELHLTRKTTREHFEEKVTLQREEAIVERVDADGRGVPEQVPVERTSPSLQGEIRPRRRNRILRGH